jgi:predicted nuclease of predicted toxin-antitoxin system
LALTKAEKPSVIQVRTQNVTIAHLSKMVIPTIETYEDLLIKGALLILDEDKKRIRILPL